MSDQINGQIRAILAGIGALLVAFGVQDSEVLISAAGAVLYGSAAIWSWVSKYRSENNDASRRKF